MPKKPDNNNIKRKKEPPVFLARLQALKQRIAKQTAEFDERQSFTFCAEYVQLKRAINSITLKSSESELDCKKITDFKLDCEKMLAGPDSKHCDVFLRSLAKCWEDPFFSKFKKELTDIADGYCASLPKPKQLILDRTSGQKKDEIAKENLRNMKRLAYTLLFATPAKALEYFESIPSQNLEIFLKQYLMKKGTRTAFSLLLRLYQEAQEGKKNDLMCNLAMTFTIAKAKSEQANEPVSIDAMTEYFNSYVSVASGVLNNEVAVNLFMDCLLVPGVMGKIDGAILTTFAEKINRKSWEGLTDRLLNLTDRLLKMIGDKRATKSDPLFIDRKSLEQSAIEEVVRKIAEIRRSSNIAHTSEHCNLLYGLIATVAVKQSKPTLWKRVLMWIGYKKPEPIFSQEQIQQLICCSSEDYSSQLLAMYFPRLDAAVFLQLMKNPCLCSANRTMLLNKFLQPEQQKLRTAVYKELDKSIALVFKWVTSDVKKPSFDAKQVSLFFQDQAFKDACKAHLTKEEAKSLKTQFANDGLDQRVVMDCLGEIVQKQSNTMQLCTDITRILLSQIFSMASSDSDSKKPLTDCTFFVEQLKTDPEPVKFTKDVTTDAINLGLFSPAVGVPSLNNHTAEKPTVGGVGAQIIPPPSSFVPP